MGKYLNPDNMLFKRAVNSEIYVDKTLLIEFTNKHINTEDQFICVSRPRRFGKSMAANMLSAYYSKGCDSRDIFKGYKICHCDDYETYLNKFNVIHINMQVFLGRTEDIREMIKYLTKAVTRDIFKSYPKTDYLNKNILSQVLEDIYEQAGVQFIFIIDEWDCVFREHQNDNEGQKVYLDFIRDLLKDQSYVALVYMTGILPVKKYGIHSALNMFTEYSVTNADPISEFTGFTEAETFSLSNRFDMPYDELKNWYDGYDIDGISIYNPKSVSEACKRHRIDSYWTSTETYEALKTYIMMDMDDLKQKISKMIAGEKIRVNTAKFQNDMTTFESSDDVITLLIHLGYLTYDFRSEKCRIPNNEVAREFINSIEDGGYGNVMKAVRQSDRCLDATLSGDRKQVAAILQDIHEDNTSVIKYNDENSLACTISLAYYTARRSYDLVREMPAGKGFADIVFLPRKNTDIKIKPPMVVELKTDESADTAIDQIKEKHYLKSLNGHKGQVILVGINYDRKSKKHTCSIEKVYIS